MLKDAFGFEASFLVELGFDSNSVSVVRVYEARRPRSLSNLLPMDGYLV